MPLYEYECEACGNRFERIQKFSDPLVDTCPQCEGHVRKLLSSPAFQFKGTGWYVTDYARKGGATDGGEKKSDGEGAGNRENKDSGDKTGKTDKTEKSDRSAESPSDKSASSTPASSPSSSSTSSSSTSSSSKSESTRSE
jgi:putative FmdB family regulatory protein